MRKSRKSKSSWKRHSDAGEWFLIGIITFGLIFFMLIAPCAVAYGVVTGHVDIETLDPAWTEKSEIHPCGGY